MKIVYNLACWFFFQGLFSCDQAPAIPRTSQLTSRLQTQKTGITANANIVFKSTDGGQTWQEVSKVLPENLPEDSFRGNSFFATDNGLFLSNSGSSYWGVNLMTTNGNSVWSPIFENFQEPRIRSVFETAGGAIFIGIDRGLFKSTNTGKTWKHVYEGGLLGNLAELNGVLLATSMRRIIRSTDNGENWELVNSDGDLAFDVKQIKGGFAAITSSTESNNRRLRTSYDSGITWQLIDAGLRDKDLSDSIWRTWNDRPRLQAYMTSIIKVGESFLCTHPDGIFRSSDKGKTWELVLPSADDKVFKLFVSDNVIYAILMERGC